jgi:hypothetical protein
MKKIKYLSLLFLVFACSSENANDCFQTAGKIITQEVDVSTFTKILVNRDIELIITEGAETKVTIETGENLLNDIEAVVIDDKLELTNNNTCNYVREYGITKVFVTAPNISEIRSSSQFEVSAQGVLNYSSLQLISEDFNKEVFAVGDFRLAVNSDEIIITSNKISSFYISGQTEDLHVAFYGGSGRFEGANLTAQSVSVFHRGSNDIIVNPQQSLTGEIRGVGNVIAIHVPAVIDVETFYTGRLIFN